MDFADALSVNVFTLGTLKAFHHSRSNFFKVGAFAVNQIATG